VRRLLAAFAWCLALPQEPGAEMVGVIRRRENPGGGPGILLAVRVFLLRYKGNSLPGPGNARWIPVRRPNSCQESR
jgi:hypothetical protein